MLRYVAVASAILGMSVTGSCQATGWTAAIDAATRMVPEARIVVLDVTSGRLLAGHRLAAAARTLAAPGSTLKPLILYALIAAGRWSPERRVACERQLSIAGHRLQCTHPPALPYDAREALTWSCNSYFAELARSVKPGELGMLLRPTRLLATTGLAQEEAIAEFREPGTTEAMQLTVLGVENVRVTPLELAAAYRWLATELVSHPEGKAAQVVRPGLEDSANFGMAGQAGLGGVPVMGKTGTAEGVATSRTHGWFAGFAPAANPRVVVVVYLPAGRGADAARVAGALLSRALPGKP